jgi:hypothetical protein
MYHSKARRERYSSIGHKSLDDPSLIPVRRRQTNEEIVIMNALLVSSIAAVQALRPPRAAEPQPAAATAKSATKSALPVVKAAKVALWRAEGPVNGRWQAPCLNS